MAAPAGVPRALRLGGRLGRDPKITGFLYALGAYLAWGLFPIYFRALRHVSPLEVLAHRIAWSAVLLAAFLAWRGGLRAALAAAFPLGRLATLGATTLLISANWLVFIWAVSIGHVLAASLGYFVTPLVNVLLGVVFLRESLRRLQVLSVLLAGAGVLWLLLGHGSSLWISLVLAVTFGLYGLVRKAARIDAVGGLFVETALLAPAALIFLASRAAAGTGALGSAPGTSALLALAGVITVLPLVWFAIGVQRLRLSTMGIIQYLTPSSQFALAVAVYREPFTHDHAVAFAFIWVSLAIYSLDALLAAGAIGSRPSWPAGNRPAGDRGRTAAPPRR
jgi:chloramphenicol-sensitive protein RarD